MVVAPFLDERRLLLGPWQAFERDVARCLIGAGFDDVRIVGGSHDKGADILGVKNKQIWVVQCKHTTTSPPPREAVKEVVDAGKFYLADRLIVATSRPPSGSFIDEVERFKRVGVNVEVLDPRRLLDLALSIPEYPKSRKELRPYQTESAEKFRDSLRETGRGQIVLATGLGKTVVMAEVVADLLRDDHLPNGRVLVLADKRELIRQLQQGFWHQLPKWAHTHRLSGDEVPTYWDGITFGTVQSVIGRLDDLPEFDLVLVDEAHHVGSPTFRETISKLKPRMLGGVTATPWRGDGFDIDDIFGQPVVKFGIAEGLKNHFLCEVDYRLMADNVKWEIVQERSRYHYSLSELNKQLIIPVRDQEAARMVADVFTKGCQSGIVFCPTVEHAEFFAATIRTFGIRSEAISSKLDARQRDKLMASFRKGLIDIVTSVDLFNEGVDVPDVDLIVFMRTTHSRRIFVQQIGRGLRLSPGKEKVTVLDFVTDLRRIAEVLQLQRAASNGPTERLPLGDHLIQFRDKSAGGFMFEWMKDQADLLLREGDPKLEIPRFDYPEIPQPGAVE